ncbi:hypothetical protein ACIQXM_17910 [Arthrobacter sp. NPDC097144]|uniref:hypothetical protein n=1 Tax=Arthrobacter sp. NPDC097144 TaxID=3363946 RepID=UPI00381AC6E3
MRRKNRLLVALGALALLLPAAAPANAVTSTPTPAPITEETKDQLGEYMDKYGVADSVQIQLWKKIEDGVLWDSFGGAEPVSSREIETDKSISTVSTFEDGSIRVAEVMTGTPGINARGITMCSTSSFPGGAQYNNCNATDGNGWATAGFTTTFIRSANYGKIVDVWAPTVQCMKPFSCSYAWHGIVRSTGTDAVPALAQMNYGLTWGGTVTNNVQLKISGASATIYNSVNN